MIIQTKQQRANTLDARLNMWPSVPAKNVFRGLGDWRADDNGRRPPDCGTIACFGGWCAWWPAFQAQGVKASFRGAPMYGDRLADVLLFGDCAIFTPAGEHPADKAAPFGCTDHELVTHRLQWLLDNSTVAE